MEHTKTMPMRSKVCKGFLLTAAIIACCLQAGISAEKAVIQWSEQWGSIISNYDYGYDVAADTAGNVYVAGFTLGSLEGSNAGNSDFFITKYNASGDEEWTRQRGSGASDYGFDVVVDNGGNVYFVGTTTASIDSQTHAGSSDMFITKFAASGDWIWTRQWGGPEIEVCNGAAADASGNIYLVGYTTGSLDGANQGYNDMFLVKYNSAGTWQWARQWGGPCVDVAEKAATDASGNIYIVGHSSSALDGSNYGAHDIVLAKYNAAGEQQWIKQWGTAGNDLGNGVAVDLSGNAYVTGISYGILHGKPYIDNGDIFLTKYNPSGEWQWTEQWGNSSYQIGYAVAVDAAGNIFVAGNTQGGLDENTNAGGTDIFVTKYNASHEKILTWQRGSGSTESGQGVAVDASGDVYVAGYTDGSLETNTNLGGYDIFLYKLHLNNPPALSWTGEENYTAGGVYLRTDGKYAYRITYTDPDNDAPASGYPKLHVKKEGAEIAGSPFTMDIVGSSGDYSAGRIYEYALTSPGGDTAYYFEARDIHEEPATGAPTQSNDSSNGIVRPPAESKAKVYHSVFKPGQSEQCYISYNAEQAGEAKVVIYDRSGRQVKMLYSGSTVPGISSLAWNGICDDGSVAPSGVYVVLITAPGVNQRKNIVVIR